MIPLATTTITVLRITDTPAHDGDDWPDPYDVKPPAAAVASGVRAHISTPRGNEQVAGGSQEVVTFKLTCDPVDLRHTDQVRDDQSAAVYEVVWTRPRTGLGLDHVEAELKQVAGVV